VVRDMPFSRTRPHDPWSVDPLSDRTATGLYIRGRSPENGESPVARVDRQNPAREQSRCAFQLVAACLTRTRLGKCRMSGEIARLSPSVLLVVLMVLVILPLRLGRRLNMLPRLERPC
jgi:hypothetical protein